MGRTTTKKTFSGHDDDEGTPVIITDRIVYLSGSVNENSIAIAIANIIALSNADPSAPIKLIISTYGGSVDEMFALYDVMKYVSCPIHTIALGKVMSAGVLLLASGTKGYRYVGKSTRIMMHPISGVADGNIFNMANEFTEMQRMQVLMEELLVKESKITKAQMKTLMNKGSDTFLTAKEAIKYGIVDAIFEQKK